MLAPGFAQIQREATIAKALQPSFKVTVAVHRLTRHQLYPATREPLVICGPVQLAIQSRRGNFENISPSGYHIFHIENRAKLTAKLGAVLVRYTCGLVEENSQHSALAAPAELNLDDLQAAGARHALCNSAHQIFIKCHCSNNLRAIRRPTFGPKLKSGLAPTGVLRQMLVLHNSFQLLNIRPSSVKDKLRRRRPKAPSDNQEKPLHDTPNPLTPSLSDDGIE